ncbi:MAG: DUF1425 domain-containing protein [Desulfovibrio sp.]
MKVVQTVMCLVVACSLFAITGCTAAGGGYGNKVTTAPGATSVANTKNVVQVGDRVRLVIGAKELLGNVMIENPRFRKVGIFTQCAALLQNVSDDRASLEYKIDWEDSQGFPIDLPTVWHHVTLSPHMSKSIISTGKSQDAYGVIITVRFPDNPFEINKESK